ncbi:hypothetical protein PLAN_160202 [Planktothrix rubescens CCAP 1459/22]|uniref:Uncharacterized protein n=1 Tax=Planktothrix rubescens CCAP 1459/22 TaxID=329571 RepID=A0A6J7ZJP0_PLARU|nr:hypothetical protein PLAN_160202 [Planktothrix rubescens NIVA-CYA 18]
MNDRSNFHTFIELFVKDIIATIEGLEFG